MSFRREIIPTLLCLSIVGYLFYDLKVIQGRSYQLLIQESKPSPIVAEQIASVYGQPITQENVEIELDKYLYRRGILRDSLSHHQYEELFRKCVSECLNNALIAHYTKKASLSPSPERIVDEVDFAQKQFSDSYAWRDALRRAQMSEEDIYEYSRQHLAQCDYLDQILPNNPPVYTSYLHPASLKVRHVFLSTWEKSASEVRAKFLNHLKSLQAGELTFEELSDLINEDLRAKASKGHLGWMTNQRLPQGLEAIFELPLSQPTLMQSSLGWHYIEVLERKPPEMVEKSQPTRSTRQEALEGFLRQVTQESQDHITLTPSS